MNTVWYGNTKPATAGLREGWRGLARQLQVDVGGIEMSNGAHAHFMSGLRGYMPDQSEMHATLRDAKQAMIDFCKSVRDGCEGGHYDQTMLVPAYCYSGRPRNGGYIEFNDSWLHGVEYAEVVECYRTDCVAEEYAADRTCSTCDDC